MTAALAGHRYVGATAAATLNRTRPCDSPICDHACRWEPDTVGRDVTRLHLRRYASGVVVSAIEYPPGDPRSEGAAVYLPDADDGMSAELAFRVAADLLDAAMSMRGRDPG